MILTHSIDWFCTVLDTALRLYFRQECSVTSVYDLPLPEEDHIAEICGIENDALTFDEKTVFLLALMPHICPQALDIFFVHNKNFDRPYTEFGGWKGIAHNGFLPTGETAAFIAAGEDPEKRTAIARLFSKEHWFYTRNILRLESQTESEPFLSGHLCISDEILSRVLLNKEYKPDYSVGFPAKRLTSPLEWDDLILDFRTVSELEEINTWISGQHTLMEEWGLKRILKNGYRTLFYGPPGTGKTLAAALIGKRNLMDVYRIDLSQIVSKYIGETEKNLARVFDLAENRRWVLFFDEADALFGKRTSTNTSNDRYANQEIAYLLQRIEDFPGTVILATNLRSNIDEAFTRRFQSVVYFPVPDEEMRLRLWQKMLPTAWLNGNSQALLRQTAAYELTGGSITNVIRRCALGMLTKKQHRLQAGDLREAIEKELRKEQKI